MRKETKNLHFKIEVQLLLIYLEWKVAALCRIGQSCRPEYDRCDVVQETVVKSFSRMHRQIIGCDEERNQHAHFFLSIHS